MKYYLISIKYYLIGFLLLAAFFADAQEVKISGIFKSSQKELKIEDISEFQYLQPQEENLVAAMDEQGNFNMQFALKKPGYYRLGRNILYLSPGDQLKVLIDHNNPSLSTFEGKGYEANSYLKDTPFPKGGSYLNAGKLIGENPEGTLQAILTQSHHRQLSLAEVRKVSPVFRELETARIQSDLINSIRSLKYYLPRKQQLGAEGMKKYQETFDALALPVLQDCKNNLLRSALPESNRQRKSGRQRKPGERLRQKKPGDSKEQLSVNDFLTLTVFRDIAPYLLEETRKSGQPESPALNKISDWIKADSIVQVMVGTSNKQILPGFRSSLSTLETSAYSVAATSLLESLLTYGNADTAKDFMATDQYGNTVRLSDFRGKIIYIDLWATWCGPCMAEMPAFEQLKKQYRDNPEVVFISLSIDESMDNWKKSLGSRNAEGVQWQVTRSTLKDYQVINIPRTIVIDDHFKIHDFQAPVPSSPSTVLMLNTLLANKQQRDSRLHPKNPHFIIQGKLENVAEGSVLFLSYTDGDNSLKRDSVKISNGQFTFSGQVPGTTRASLMLSRDGSSRQKKNSDLSSLYLGLDQAEIKITGTDSIASADIVGGKENSANQSYKKLIKPIEASIKALYASLTPETRKDKTFIARLKEQLQVLNERRKRTDQQFIADHPDVMLSLDVLKNHAGPIFDSSEILRLFRLLAPEVSTSKAGIAYESELNLRTGLESGQLAPDFELPDSNGKRVRLSSFRGQYVLVDFWASWCAPCRAGHPDLVKQFQKFKDRNFTIISISMDALPAKQAWLKAIKDDGLTWTNVSDLQGWNNAAGKRYQIKAIPQNFLIAPDGKIVAKNLHGEQLTRILEQLIL
ncbi:redoxin domain-containing protein [Pedobacter sp. AW31-3R]|uniref:redoxin domain-containing protein n=1 Tax=Pedobacter sp. AW31-3R TaxID=3445781 RepID=UPI003F9F76A5